MRRWGAILLLGSAGCSVPDPAAGPGTPEARAVAFLAREVPAWPFRNRCFSCHNNGDAARALWAAKRRSIPFDAHSLETTRSWLLRPGEWRSSGPPGDVGDPRLAALQFGSALVSSGEGGSALERAAELVRTYQGPDGSWAVDAGGLPGSPVTWGRTLATVLGRRILDEAGLREAVERADGWLASRKPVTVLEAGALLLAPGTSRETCLRLLRQGQSSEGGWGPYVASPPEVFDTAVALLGLARVRDQAAVDEMIRRGRGFLVALQQADGGWPETTRPSGAESYAQRISTTGWATLALLETR